jgi:putative PIN family toxin of toxin-antitoxin system
VFVGHCLTGNPLSPNTRVVRLWRDERSIQLIVSDEVAEEYLDVLRRLHAGEPRIQRFAERLQRRETVTRANLGSCPTDSRDPDDNVMLATAVAGKARFVVTNDRDLLEIPHVARRRFRFAIVTPVELLERVESKRA